MRNKFIYLFWILFFIFLLFSVVLFSLFAGLDKFSSKDSLRDNIIFDIRLPRIILGIIVGGLLALSGLILQGLFRNVLVEPYTLGISGGAALGAIFASILNLKFYSYPFAFLGAIFVIIFLYFFSIKGGIFKIEELLLNGVMISFISSSLIMLVMALFNVNDLRGIIFWIMGSLEDSDWQVVKIGIFILFFGLFFSYFFWKDLNALHLGEEEAMHLGINVERTKRVLFILASFFVSFCVSSCGIIGFVGLVVPHFLRMVLSYDYRVLLVSSFLVGGIFLVFSDTIARLIIFPLELPVGVITGILGGIVFIYVLRKNRLRF